jgi:hypothetical protein
MAKAAFDRKKILFTSKVDLNTRKTILKCYRLNTALSGIETWRFGK